MYDKRERILTAARKPVLGMAGDQRLLFQAKSLPIPAIHGKTRSTIGVRSPRSAKGRQALGEGGAVRVFCGQGPI